MNATFYHAAINVHDVAFYKELLAYLGFKTVAEYHSGFGASDGKVSLWVFKVSSKYVRQAFHRKAVGINHFAFRVESKATVDTFYKDYLLPNGISVLYGGPAEHPEYEPGYYAVYFEDPDRIKLEVVYKP
jgi:catechol 2,3-dioxygenase-like lactoylglutathione lyase family enzyme